MAAGINKSPHIIVQSYFLVRLRTPSEEAAVRARRTPDRAPPEQAEDRCPAEAPRVPGGDKASIAGETVKRRVLQRVGIEVHMITNCSYL